MLPVVEIPKYSLEVPSTKQKLIYRPFLVKEEKVLALALQDGNEETVINAVKELVNACTFGKLDVDKMPSFDFDYIFLNIRSKSKGNTVDLSYECQNEVDGKVCGTSNKFQINLDNVKVISDPKHSKKVMITSSIGVMMKYPTFDNIVQVEKLMNTGNIAGLYAKIGEFIECVFEGDKIEDTFTNDEITTWLENLQDKHFEKIIEFFASRPKIMMEVETVCSKCGHKEKFTLEGLRSFLV
jgi:hypothetical protein